LVIGSASRKVRIVVLPKHHPALMRSRLVPFGIAAELAAAVGEHAWKRSQMPLVCGLLVLVRERSMSSTAR